MYHMWVPNIILNLPPYIFDKVRGCADCPGNNRWSESKYIESLQSINKCQRKDLLGIMGKPLEEGHKKTLCNDGGSSEWWEWIWTSFQEAIPSTGIFHPQGIALFDDSISSIASVLDWFQFKIFLLGPTGPFQLQFQKVKALSPQNTSSVVLLSWLSYKSVCEILRGTCK